MGQPKDNFDTACGQIEHAGHLLRSNQVMQNPAEQFTITLESTRGLWQIAAGLSALEVDIAEIKVALRHRK
jgi:hypothetical protein